MYHVIHSQIKTLKALTFPESSRNCFIMNLQHDSLNLTQHAAWLAAAVVSASSVSVVAVVVISVAVVSVCGGSW
jgi:hypothetical protein